MLALNEYRAVIDYDREGIFNAFKDLIKYFAVEPATIRWIYLHKKIGDSIYWNWMDKLLRWIGK